MGGFLWFQHALSSSILQERSTIESLIKQETNLKGVISHKNALLSAYRDDLNKIKEFNFEFPADNVSFFASIERVMAGNKLKINKINPIKPLTQIEAAYLWPARAIITTCSTPFRRCALTKWSCACLL